MLYFSRVISIAFFKSLLSIKSEISNNKLGYLSLLIEPILLIATYYIVFGVLVSKGEDEQYIFFLISGIIPWIWIQRTISRSSLSLVKGKGLIQQLKIEKTYFILVEVFSELIKLFIPMTIILLILGIFGYATLSWLKLLIVIPVVSFFVFSISFVVSIIVVFFRDLHLVIPSLMRVLMYLSGVVYNITSLPSDILFYLKMNPLYIVIEIIRSVLLGDNQGLNGSLLIIVIISVIIFLFGLFVSKKYNNEISLEIIK